MQETGAQPKNEPSSTNEQNDPISTPASDNRMGLAQIMNQSVQDDNLMSDRNSQSPIQQNDHQEPSAAGERAPPAIIDLTDSPPHPSIPPRQAKHFTSIAAAIDGDDRSEISMPDDDLEMVKENNKEWAGKILSTMYARVDDKPMLENKTIEAWQRSQNWYNSNIVRYLNNEKETERRAWMFLVSTFFTCAYCTTCIGLTVNLTITGRSHRPAREWTASQYEDRPS